MVKTELEKRGDWIRNGWRRDPRAYVEAGNVWATRGGSACFSVGQLSEWSTMGLMAAAALATRLLVEPAEAADLVARAKGISIKTLEPGLDDRSLDSWLRERVWRGATMSWRGIECRTARGELGEAPSDIGDCVQVVVDAPPPPVHADRFRCQVALELKLPLQGTDRAPAVVWMASRLTRTEDWTRVQRLDDIASRVRACDEAVREAVDRELRFLRTMERQDYLSWLALLGGPLVVGFGSLLLGARLADRIERRRMSLKRAVGILGLGAAGTLVGAWSLVFLLDWFERLVFSTTGIYAHEGGAAAAITLLLDLILWVPATFLAAVAVLFAAWRTRHAGEVELGHR